MDEKRTEAPPAISREDAEEWSAGLGQISAGGWRLVRLAHRLGVPAALGLTTEEWVNQKLGGHVRLSIDDRRAAASEMDEEGLKQREIAAVLGVGRATVARDLSAPDGAGNGDDLAENPANSDPVAPNGPARKKKPTEAPHPHSDRVMRWLAMVIGEMDFIDLELGGLAKMLAERRKWDRREMREAALPILETLEGRLRDFKRELNDAFTRSAG